MPSEPTFYRKPTYITDCEEYIAYHCFVTGNKDILIYKTFEKDIILEPLPRPHNNVCHAHLHGIMSRKFYLDDLKNMAGVWDRTFH